MLKSDQDLIQATSVLLSVYDTSMWNKCAYHVMVMPDARVIIMKKADMRPVLQSLSSRAELFKV